MRRSPASVWLGLAGFLGATIAMAVGDGQVRRTLAAMVHSGPASREGTRP